MLGKWRKMHMEERKKRVRSLLRVSSRQQLHDDDIPVQRAEIANYIEGRPDWEFDREYIEKAVSAYKNTVQDREVLLQILEDARMHQFDVLLTFMSDRIGRKEEYNMYIATLNQLGIEVWTIKEGLLDTQEDTDRLTLFIKFWSNERESRKTGERVKAAQQEMVRQGKHAGGYAPYGYELMYNGEIGSHGRSLKELRIVESEANVVREIFRLAVEEKLGAYAIAKRLNEQHIPAINGGEWKACTISDRLKNPIYMGYFTYNRRSHRKSYQRNPVEEWVFSEKPSKELQIVSPSVWKKAQELREKRKSNIDNKKGADLVTTTGSLPLMGLIYCASCGCRLTNGSRYDQWTLKDGTKVKKMNRRYRCTQRANASTNCQGAVLYSADEIEPVVFAEVKQYMAKLKQSNVYTDLLKKQEKARKVIRREIEEIRKEQRAVQKDIDTLESQIPQALRGEGIFSAEKLSGLLKEKEKQKEGFGRLLEEKEQEYQVIEPDNRDIDKSSQIIPNWEQEFMEADTHLKKVLLSKIIERIEIGKDKIKIVFKISEETFRREENPGITASPHTTPYTPGSV